MNTTYSLKHPFDVIGHKATFINYLEVIISADGSVEYAVPSHQEKLITIACEQFQISREVLNTLCPEEFYGDFTRWLCNITNCVAVWNEFTEGTPNTDQVNTLHFLRAHDVFKGSIPVAGEQTTYTLRLEKS